MIKSDIYCLSSEFLGYRNLKSNTRGTNKISKLLAGLQAQVLNYTWCSNKEGRGTYSQGEWIAGGGITQDLRELKGQFIKFKSGTIIEFHDNF